MAEVAPRAVNAVLGASQRVAEMRIIVRDNGRFTDLWDGREPTQYAVAFDLHSNGFHLRALPRDQWSDNPTVMDVNTLSGYATCRK